MSRGYDSSKSAPGCLAPVAQAVGISNFSGKDVLDVVKQVNEDDDVTGVMVQLPLSEQHGIGSEGERLVLEALGIDKDVDG